MILQFSFVNSALHKFLILFGWDFYIDWKFSLLFYNFSIWVLQAFALFCCFCLFFLFLQVFCSWLQMFLQFSVNIHIAFSQKMKIFLVSSVCHPSPGYLYTCLLLIPLVLISISILSTYSSLSSLFSNGSFCDLLRINLCDLTFWCFAACPDLCEVFLYYH